MSSKEEIIEQLTRIVEENLDNERFGVEELAEAYAVSRSTLLRTLKKHTGLSANQFIKEVRLDQARVMLSETEKTISEISYDTGFSSPSYFIKCYKEQYGHSPGESRQEAITNLVKKELGKEGRRTGSLSILVAIVAFIIVLVFFWNRQYKSTGFSGKSIAVLPFKNESADSTNLYFVNGMMESILNHLQRIEDLRVISRTSVEQYRNQQFTIPEIARDLGVDYVLEGSGQKAGNDILLTVQLIKAEEDRHLWSEQYNRQLSDVFKLQAEVSKKIASEIEVVINPEVKEQIDEVPTENLEAYDAFLKGLEFIQGQSESNLDSGIAYFKRAIELDEQFANPHAYIAICYYYKDLFKVEKEHLEDLGVYADRALLLNNELPEALISRGLYYMLLNKYEKAREYFEKVLTYNPNSAWTHNFLSEIYHRYLPNTEKYLIHALLALQLDLRQSDSIDVSISHLILANALAQSGLMSKAAEHVQVSLDYDPQNTFSRYLSIFIDLAEGKNLPERSIQRMHEVYKDDTTRLDVLKELATLYYGQQDWAAASTYFGKFTQAKELYGLNIYPDADITIAYVARSVGDTARAARYRRAFQSFVEQNQTIYQPFTKAMALLYDGRTEEALDALEEFAKAEDYMYWLLLIREDPIFSEVKEDPRFLEIYDGMKTDFEARRERRINQLTELGLWE